MKKKLCILLAALLATSTLTACGGTAAEAAADSTVEASAPADDSDSPQGTPPEGAPSDGADTGTPPDGRSGHRGGMMTENTDPEIQAVLDENADKFEQFTYDDPETGLSLEYSLYIPEDYDSSQEYPLLMYIPDSTGSGKTARELVEQYYGATVWVTDEDQARHSTFVLVPAFSETVVDDNWNVSDQVEAAVHLIAQLQKDYSIDDKRIYTTGQSMGCMTSLYLNSKYPDLFAASLFVSGQWDVSVLQPLEGKASSISRRAAMKRLPAVRTRSWRCWMRTVWPTPTTTGTHKMNLMSRTPLWRRCFPRTCPST